MQHPWLLNDPLDCDGPCFGWYKFEDTIIPELVIFNLEALFGTILGIIARVILKKKKSNEQMNR
jgi:hypothetical protein